MPTLSLSILLILAYAQAPSHRYTPRDGDVVFQTSVSRQSKAIQAVTGSRFSHIGVVFTRNGVPVVYEAIGPVKYTPLKEWIAKGLDQRFVVKRLNSVRLTRDQVRALKIAGARYHGKDYDTLFAWSDHQIYCSELVYKMFKSALGVEVGKLERFGDFDLSNPLAQAIVQERWAGNPPLDEPVVTPASIFASPLLTTVFQH